MTKKEVLRLVLRSLMAVAVVSIMVRQISSQGHEHYLSSLSKLAQP